MAMNSIQVLCLAILALGWSAVQADLPATQEKEPEQESVPECGLYLAVSSTSTVDEPKWGIFAGNTIPKHAPIGSGGEVGIQTFQLHGNIMDVDDYQVGTVLRTAIVDFLEQYIWVPHNSGGQFELPQGKKVVTAVPGIGVVGGCKYYFAHLYLSSSVALHLLTVRIIHPSNLNFSNTDNPKLINADWNHSVAFHRPAWGEQMGVSHPGRGASSSFFDVTLSALSNIPAGMEIFVNYGENWNEEEENENDITKEDHPKIDQTIDKMIDFFDKYHQELDDESRQEIYRFLIDDVLTAAAGAAKGKKIAKLMPESPEGLKALKAMGGAAKLTSPQALRTLPWLAEHGRCMDNLRPGPSTIPNAGRGALATRNLPAGSKVAPMPLIHIPNGEIFDMFELETRVDEGEEEEYLARVPHTKPTGAQLMLNYCLGHPDSKMLFFPAGSMTGFINHSPTPNAKLIWSDHPNNHKHWFDLNPMALLKEGSQHLGLMMEVVAIADIKEGDEVTIDYGPEWAAAWKEHVEKWEASTKEGKIASTWPVRALEYNNQFVDKPIPVNKDNYPENLMIKCFLLVAKPTDEPAVNESGEKIRIWTDTARTMRSENLFDCELIDVQEITTPEGTTSWEYTAKWNGKGSVSIVKKIPQKAVVFVDKPGTSDQHIDYAFRHYIGIPDELFPQGRWRNRNTANMDEDKEVQNEERREDEREEEDEDEEEE